MQLNRWRITPAFIVAIVALVFAMAGGAVAASKITGSQIAKNTITGKNVKDGALAVSDLSPAARAALRGARGPAGPQGAQGGQGAQGAQGIPGVPGAKGTTDIVYVDGAPATVNPGDSGFSDAFCPEGTVATGGALGPASDGLFNDGVFFGVEGSRFFVEIFNAGSTPHTVQARVACARK